MCPSPGCLIQTLFIVGTVLKGVKALGYSGGALDLRNVIQMSNVSNPIGFVTGATIKCLAQHPSDRSISDFQCRCSLTVTFLHMTSAGKITTNDLPHQVHAIIS